MFHMALSLFLPKPDQYRFWLVLMVLSLFGQVLFAADYYSNPAGNTGNFGNANVWATTAGGTVGAFPANPNLHTFHIMSGDNITLSDARTAGVVIVESGGILTNGGTFTLTCPTLTINAGGTLNIIATRFTTSGSWTNNGSITLTSGRLTYSTGAGVNNGSITYSATGGRLEKTSGTLTNGATGTISVTGTATVTLSTGNFVNNNTSSSVNFGASAIALTGTAQSVGGFTTTGAVTATNASGTITLTGNINGSTFTKSNAGTINMGTGLTHTFTGTFALGAAGSVNGGSSTINVNVTSATAWTGTGTIFTPGTGTVNFGGVAQTLSATGTKTFYNLTLSNSGVKTIATTTVNNVLSMEGTASVSVAPTYGANATLRYNSTTGVTAGAEWLGTFAATGGVIIASTGAIVTNGNKVFNLNIPLTINSGATLSPAAGNTFSFGGDLINNGTWTASTGDVTITLARVGQSIGRFSTIGLVTMSKASQAATFTGNINGGAFTMNGAGTLNLGTGLTHTFTGAWTNTAGTLQGNTSTLNIGGTGSGTGVTFTAGTSTVNFNGAGAQNIPTFSYYNLNTSTGGTKTLLGSTTVSNVLTVGTSSTFATGAFTLTLSGTGTPLVDNGTFTATVGGTVIYSGATANIAAESYASLQTSTAGVKTLAGNTTVSTVLTVNSGSTLAIGANTLTLTGTGTPLVDNGTFTASASSTVIYSGATATVAGETYENLQASTAGAKTLGASTTVNGVLTINSGSTLALSTFTLTLSGTGTPLVNSGGTFTPSTGTVIYSGATATIAALTYYNIQTSTAGSKTLAGTTTVNNILTINSPSTLDLSAFTVSLLLTGTPLVNNGTISGTGRVLFSGAGAQTVAGTTYYDLEFSGAGTKTITTGTTVTVSNNWIVGGTTTMTTTASANVTGNISGAGAITMGSGTINIAGNWTNNGTFTCGTGTVIYDGTTQSIGGLTYHNLQTSNSGVKTLAGGTTVANILTVGASTTLDLSSVTLTLSAAGSPLVKDPAGTFTASTSKVIYSTGAQNIALVNYYDLDCPAGAKTYPAGNIGIAGIFNPTGSTQTVDNANIINFNGVNPTQAITGGFPFKKVILSGSGQKIISTTVGVTEVEIQDGPTMDITTGQLDIN